MQVLQLATARLAAAAPGIVLHGPLPAPMPRRAGYQRLQLVVSATERRDLHAALAALVPGLHEIPEARKVRWSLDVDPVDQPGTGGDDDGRAPLGFAWNDRRASRDGGAGGFV